MVNQQLFDYIRQQLQEGVSSEQIKSSLLANGWPEDDINEAFVSINSPLSATPLENIAPQEFSTVSQQPEQRKNKILVAIVSLLGVLTIGGVAFGYFYYFQETPEEVIGKMIARLPEIKTLEFQGEIKAEIAKSDLLEGINFMPPAEQTPGNTAGNFTFIFSGKSDISDLSNPKGLLLLNIKTDALKELTQEETNIDVELRIINKLGYVKLSNLPNIAPFDFEFLSNQWIKIGSEATEDQYYFENIHEQNRQPPELTPEQTKKIGQQIQGTFEIAEMPVSEKIEGVDTHHYKFSMDVADFRKLLADVIAVTFNVTITDEERADFYNTLEAIETFSGEIWIGKDDYLPYKVILRMGIKETAISKTAGQLTTTVSFKNHNKPIQVDIPSPVKSIIEVMGQLFRQFMGNQTMEFSHTVDLQFEGDSQMLMPESGF